MCNFPTQHLSFTKSLLLFVCRHLKYTDDTTSRDSDSLIQDYGGAGLGVGNGSNGLGGGHRNNNMPIYYSTTTGGSGSSNVHYTTCWRHPKVRENWRTVLAAFALLFVGTGLVIMGAFSISETNNTSQGKSSLVDHILFECVDELILTFV